MLCMHVYACVCMCVHVSVSVCVFSLANSGAYTGCVCVFSLADSGAYTGVTAPRVIQVPRPRAPCLNQQLLPPLLLPSPLASGSSYLTTKTHPCKRRGTKRQNCQLSLSPTIVFMGHHIVLVPLCSNHQLPMQLTFGRPCFSAGGNSCMLTGMLLPSLLAVNVSAAAVVQMPVPTVQRSSSPW